MGVSLLSPTNGRPLQEYAPNLLDDGERLWPVVDGIAYLRPKEDLRRRVVESITGGREREALLLLLADQDRFSPTVPPTAAALEQLIGRADQLKLRQAMELLNFGPVGDYFAYRWCSPTFASGLRLLERSVPAQGAREVVEYACGIGHFLRELEGEGVPTIGVDVVYAKLWLARNFMEVRGTLVCGDVEASQVVAPGASRSVFCHDAFYFFEQKEAALAHLRNVAAGGSVAVGHVHTQLDGHRAGFADTLTDYARFADGQLLDDKSLADAWYGGGEAGVAESDSAAVAWVEGSLGGPSDSVTFAGSRNILRLNPLLGEQTVRWPSEGWRSEYWGDLESASPYAINELQQRADVQALVASPASVAHLDPSERARLYREQVLLNLPPRW